VPLFTGLHGSDETLGSQVGMNINTAHVYLLTWNRGKALPAPQLGIENISKGIASEGKTQNCDSNGQPRKAEKGGLPHSNSLPPGDGLWSASSARLSK
jgi:hypothetical protein